jgi:hypothetical protein
MIITISVVATCVILIVLNVYLVIKDYFDKQNIENFMSRRVKRISDDMFYMDQELTILKRNVDALRVDIVKLTSNPQDIVDLSMINNEITTLESKVDLALMSIKTIQDNFL